MILKSGYSHLATMPGAGAGGVAAPGPRQHGAAQGLVELLEALEVPLVVNPHLDGLSIASYWNALII